MYKLVIYGGTPLKGTIKTSGSKNAALPIFFSSILADGPLILSNTPQLSDVSTTLRLLMDMGSNFVLEEDGSIFINSSELTNLTAEYSLVKTMRASILTLGPMLAKYKKAKISLPGGCAIGTRPVNLHLNARFNKKLAQEEAWIRQGIKARRTRNEGRVRALEAMRKQFINKRKQQGNVKIHALEDEKRVSKIVFEVKNVSYSIAELELVKQFSLLILKGEKIGIIGGNGSGKSTLIRLLLGELLPNEGNIRRSKTIQLAYFDQMRESLDPNLKAMDFVSGGKDYIDINGKSKHVIGYLRQFLFTGKQAMAPIKMFSGGEKNRLMLAKILSQPANLLVLDEPTNDLDVETLELLEEMLVDYAGTLILISHDRTFLNNIVSSTIVMEGNAVIDQYSGGYDDYILQKNDKLNDKALKQSDTKSKPKKSSQKLSYNDQQLLKSLPEKIEDLENEISMAQKMLSDPDFYQNPDAQNLTIKLSTMEKELGLLYDKWSELDNGN